MKLLSFSLKCLGEVIDIAKHDVSVPATNWCSLLHILDLFNQCIRIETKIIFILHTIALQSICCINIALTVS